MPRGRCPAPRRDRRRGPARTRRDHRADSARGDRASARGDRAAARGDRAAEPEPPIARRTADRPPSPAPPVESTRRLIGASFDLLNRSSDEMRRASFYIGLVVLGTVGPFALASWALEVVSIHKTNAEMRLDPRPAARRAGSAFLGSIAIAGLLVAAVESRTMATAHPRRPADRSPDRRSAGALARSRMVFWRVDRRLVHRRDPGGDRPAGPGRRLRGHARQADRRLARLVDARGRARRCAASPTC